MNARCTAIAVAAGCISAVLQGCGTASPPTPSPAPSPTDAPTQKPTPRPTLAPTGPPTQPATLPPPAFCDDAACCKAKSRNAHDGQLCDDFYNVNAGIAWTMVSMSSWNMTRGQVVDNAVFSQAPPTQRLDNAQEAMTLAHFQKGMMPWGGWTQYGFAFGLGKSSNFWRYFQKNSEGAVCGQSHDGQRCCPACRMPLGDMTHEQFMAQVTPIISQTGKNSWNEFDVNGLSGPDLYGVLVDYTNDKNWHKTHPDDATMCKFLAKAYPKRTTAWPLYVYQYVPQQESSSVSLEKYLDCGSSVEVVQV